MNEPYQNIDQLIAALIKIKEEGSGPLNFPKTFLLLSQEIIELKKEIDKLKKNDGMELKSEFGCSFPIKFNTSEGVKIILPGKRYDDNLNEIGNNDI